MFNSSSCKKAACSEIRDGDEHSRCRIVYVIHTFYLASNKKRKDKGKNFSRRDCIRKFSYQWKFSYHGIFCSFMSEEILQ
jgi:hypothetical protein